MDYAIIRLGGKQYRVREGQTLVVDRVRASEGETFSPDVLLGDDGVTVTAKVVSHGRGPKIRIGKYKRRTGYRRHTGFRAATSQVEISLGAPKRAKAKATSAEKVEKQKPEQPEETAGSPVEGVPDGYEQLTVAQVAAQAKSWDRPSVQAALEYEQAHSARKGAIAALESALKAKED
jgi:large subunit ribosomal protein L21